MGRDTVPGFAEALRRLREAKGWSLAELADASGTHPTSLSKIELGARAPSLRLALALAMALGVPLAEMVPPSASGQARRGKSRDHARNSSERQKDT